MIIIENNRQIQKKGTADRWKGKKRRKQQRVERYDSYWSQQQIPHWSCHLVLQTPLFLSFSDSPYGWQSGVSIWCQLQIVRRWHGTSSRLWSLPAPTAPNLPIKHSHPQSDHLGKLHCSLITPSLVVIAGGTKMKVQPFVGEGSMNENEQWFYSNPGCYGEKYIYFYYSLSASCKF